MLMCVVIGKSLLGAVWHENSSMTGVDFRGHVLLDDFWQLKQY